MGKKILIIEDNVDIRENAAELLELADYETLTAPNGKQGVAIAFAELPDLILCDIMMPEMDGYGVLYMLHTNQKTAQIPFIFITAKTERADVRKGMEMGADDYLTKPFDDIELLKAVESRLQRASKPKAPVNRQQPAETLLKDLIQNSRRKSYQPKQNIYQDGDDASYLYYVFSGKIKVYVDNADAREITTALFTETDFFGYEALLLNSPHTNNAATLTIAEVGMIRKEHFIDLLLNFPGLSITFLNLLAGNLAEKDQQMLNLAYSSVRKRVADALISIAEKFGVDNDAAVIKVSRDDLAALVGTAGETISRNLSDFVDEGLITKDGTLIVIPSVKKLYQVKQ